MMAVLYPRYVNPGSSCNDSYSDHSVRLEARFDASLIKRQKEIQLLVDSANYIHDKRNQKAGSSA